MNLNPCEFVKFGPDNKLNKIVLLTDKVQAFAFNGPVYDPDMEMTAQKVVVFWEGKIWEHDYKDKPYPYDPDGRDIKDNSMTTPWTLITCGQ